MFRAKETSKFPLYFSGSSISISPTFSYHKYFGFSDVKKKKKTTTVVFLKED
jgi:hypothetical protein